MNRRREQTLLARREDLMVRSAALRQQFATHAHDLRGPVGVADRVVDGYHWLLRNPLWPLAAVGLLVISRPRALARLGLRGFGAWRLWKRFRPYAGPLLRGLLGR